jgi:hypothetical protein
MSEEKGRFMPPLPKMSKGDISVILSKLESIRRHIRNVQDAAELLANRLIQKGETTFAITLLANVMAHDQSKYRGIEFEFLHPGEDKELFNLALKQHWASNPHHPEYWQGIQAMPRIYIAEMIADLKARSEEFGNDLREYIKGEFAERHKLTVRCKPMVHINYFLDLLLEKPFKKTSLPEV